MIHKEYKLLFRDIAASRRSGMPIDVTEPQNAAIQVAEEEDKLLFTGEYTGWRALGIEGLATATGRNTCLLYTSPSPRDGLLSRMPSSA